ncbi:MAG: hypothetical protein JXL67_14085 [Calditrichaeota bacterium]|nr:hypothetical protein [Calditrichota bacterium]
MNNNIIIILITSFITLSGWQCDREKAEPLSTEMASEIASLPDEAPAIGYMNVQNLRESPFFSIFEDRMDDGTFCSEEYNKFMDATGLDIHKDIHQVYFCFFPGEESRFLAVVTGNYQPEAIIEYVRTEMDDEQLFEEPYGTYMLYSTGDEEFTISFSGNQRLIVGTRKLVKNWIDGVTSVTPEKMSKETLERLRTIQYKSDGWMTIRTEDFMEKIEESRERHPEGSRFKGLQSLQQVNFSMKLNEKINFAGISIFTTAEKADIFKEALEGWIATAKLAVSDERKAVDVLNKIDIDSHGQEVSIRFEFTREDLRTLRSQDLKLAMR